MSAPSELLEILRQKIVVLQGHCELFDASETEEWATEIATDIGVLVHDSNAGSRSLLGQLQHLGFGKTTLQFLDTSGTGSTGIEAQPRGVGWTDGFPLTALRVDLDVPSAVCVANTNPPPGQSRRVPFLEWWEKPILRLLSGETYSRGWLIRISANKEGGAHVDLESRPPAYLRLRTGGETGFRWSIGPDGNLGIGIRFEEGGIAQGDAGVSPLTACIRQIAHELLETLRTPYPEYVTYVQPDWNGVGTRTFFVGSMKINTTG